MHWPKRKNLVELALHVLKYIGAGFLIWFIGSIFFGDSLNFVSRSEPAQLIVLELQTRRNTDGFTMFRPVLALEAAQPPREQYAGNHWTLLAPHAVGDVVSGRYDPKSGEMRSDYMLGKYTWVGRIARIIGILIGLQGVALIFGVPEHRLPLRVRLGARRRPRRTLW
jgi:hypothetical protein